jgi:hypothetical protein
VRRISCLILLWVILIPLATVLAQEEPVTTEEQPVVETTTAPEIPVLVSARSDIELLADDQIGIDRPLGWSGSLDIEDPQLAILMRLDLELLAGELLGPDRRPVGWFGAVPSTSLSIARDIRHDLELLADTVIGQGVRPEGWIGDDPLMRCNRATQTLVNLLERGGVFVLQLNLEDPNYCTAVEIQATKFTEVNLLSNPDVSGGDLFSAYKSSGPYTISSGFAVGFMDRFTAQRAGVIPNGTGFTPLGRSYAQFSNMMLIQGDGFTVFVDYQFTTVTADEFEVLPDVSALTATTFCTAKWCTIAG